MADRLVDEGVEVHGIARVDSRPSASAAVPQDVSLHVGDLNDRGFVEKVVADVQPTEIYNLAGISSVARSWHEPVETSLVCGVAVSVLLGAALKLQEVSGRNVSFVQASSAEVFGEGTGEAFNEESPMVPLNPYGAAKAFAQDLVRIYRKRGLAAASCILFSHESPRRPDSFVSRKITSAAARIGRDRKSVV